MDGAPCPHCSAPCPPVDPEIQPTNLLVPSLMPAPKYGVPGTWIPLAVVGVGAVLALRSAGCFEWSSQQPVEPAVDAPTR
jgi:hypothetical protein